MKKRDERGFTLVEMMAAATILGVGLMGMAAMQGISFTKNVDANDLSVVTKITSDMMERIQNNRRYAWAYNNLQSRCRQLPGRRSSCAASCRAL